MIRPSIIAVLLFSNVVASAADLEAYDYRGIKLGIGLSEFRKTVPAARNRQLTEKHGLADFAIIPVCTGDEWASEYPVTLRLLPRKETKDSGGTSCVWMYIKAPSGIMRHAVATVPLGDYAVDNYRIEFIKKPGDSEPILFRIEIRVPYTAYPTVSIGLSDRFGQPAMRTEILQNKMGAKFDSLVSTWSNTISTIELNQRYYEIEQGIVRYELVEYAKFANSLAEKHLHESSKM